MPLTGCSSFGYLADTTITVDGQSGDALLCLELVIIDAAAGAVGAKAHIARYTRTKKRFGTDVIDLDAFTELASPRTANWWANSPPRGTWTAIAGGSEQ